MVHIPLQITVLVGMHGMHVGLRLEALEVFVSVHRGREDGLSLCLLTAMGSSGRWMLWTLCLCFTALEIGEWTCLIFKLCYKFSKQR